MSVHTLQSLLQVDVSGFSAHDVHAKLLKFFPHCTIDAIKEDADKQRSIVSFFWTYKAHASRVLQYKVDNIDVELKNVLTLNAFCIAILLPYWCIGLASPENKVVIALLLDYFFNSDPNDHGFVDKATIITQGLKYLQAEHRQEFESSRITGLEWECVFYLANQNHSMTELKQNIAFDPDIIDGMTIWYKQCTEDVKKEHVGDVVKTT